MLRQMCWTITVVLSFRDTHVHAYAFSCVPFKTVAELRKARSNYPPSPTKWGETQLLSYTNMPPCMAWNSNKVIREEKKKVELQRGDGLVTFQKDIKRRWGAEEIRTNAIRREELWEKKNSNNIGLRPCNQYSALPEAKVWRLLGQTVWLQVWRTPNTWLDKTGSMFCSC